MGEGSFGCQCTSAGNSGQSNGRWTTVPGTAASRSTSSVARSTARCVAASFGWPSGRPNGNSIAATRGAPAAAVRSGDHRERDGGNAPPRRVQHVVGRRPMNARGEAQH